MDVDQKKAMKCPRLKRMKGACVPTALWYLSGGDEGEVIRVCKAFGFREGTGEEAGMDDEDWIAAARHFGIRVRRVACEDMRLDKFVNNHREGLFVVHTWDHMLVVENGKVIDPREGPGLRRFVRAVWRVGRA